MGTERPESRAVPKGNETQANGGNGTRARGEEAPRTVGCSAKARRPEREGGSSGREPENPQSRQGESRESGEPIGEGQGRKPGRRSRNGWEGKSRRDRDDRASTGA